MRPESITRLSTVSRAAPTRNFEYEEYENSLAAPCVLPSAPAQTESDVAARLPSKQGLIRSSCYSADNFIVQDMVAAAIISLAAQSTQACCKPSYRQASNETIDYAAESQSQSFLCKCFRVSEKMRLFCRCPGPRRGKD